jgi:hypothetical protein
MADGIMAGKNSRGRDHMVRKLKGHWGSRKTPLTSTKDPAPRNLMTFL